VAKSLNELFDTERAQQKSYQMLFWQQTMRMFQRALLEDEERLAEHDLGGDV